MWILCTCAPRVQLKYIIVLVTVTGHLVTKVVSLRTAFFFSTVYVRAPLLVAELNLREVSSGSRGRFLYAARVLEMDF